MHYPVRVLFLGTGNPARSRMAGGFLRAIGNEHFAAFSAGIESKTLHALACG